MNNEPAYEHHKQKCPEEPIDDNPCTLCSRDQKVDFTDVEELKEHLRKKVTHLSSQHMWKNTLRAMLII